MSRLGINNLESLTDNVPPKLYDLDQSREMAQGCWAWVVFDGDVAGSPSILDEFNVTSLTDNGIGDYTINFANAMPSLNYAFVPIVDDGNASASLTCANEQQATARTTSAIRFEAASVSNTSPRVNFDPQYASAAVFVNP